MWYSGKLGRHLALRRAAARHLHDTTPIPFLRKIGLVQGGASSSGMATMPLLADNRIEQEPVENLVDLSGVDLQQVNAPEGDMGSTQREPASTYRDVINYNMLIYSGGVCEWLKQAVLKTAVRETVPGVRIPLPPPF
jgi:hypothetical protein